MKILSILLMSVMLYASQSHTGKLSLYLTNVDAGGKIFNVVLSSVQLNNDFWFDNYYLESAFTAYSYAVKPSVKIYNQSNNSYFKQANVGVRSLYISRKMNNITVGAGILPLSQSFYSKTSSDFVKEGEGLTLLQDIDLPGLFLKYNEGNNINNSNKIYTILIFSKDNKNVPTNKYKNKHKRNNDYIFLINSISHKKFRFISEVIFSKEYYDKNYLGNSYVAGTSINYDDTEYSGINLYAVIGASKYKKYNGWSFVVGARKDFDIFKKDMFVHEEFFKPFDHWYSHNSGNLQENNYNEVYNIYNFSTTSTLGIQLRDNVLLTLDYSYSTIKRFNEIKPTSYSILNFKVKYSF